MVVTFLSTKVICAATILNLNIKIYESESIRILLG